MSKSICKFPECVNPSKSRGLCNGHYLQDLQGREMRPLGRRSYTAGMTIRERFEFYIEKTETCWNWTGTKLPDGYGLARIEGGTRAAHRMSYEIAVGPIPEGMQVDHRCFNKGCVRPSHLRATTPKQNSENLAGARTGSKSGYRGVSWYSKTQKWRAQVGHNMQIIHIGFFDDVHEAGAAALAKRMELFTHSDGR